MPKLTQHKIKCFHLKPLEISRHCILLQPVKFTNTLYQNIPAKIKILPIFEAMYLLIGIKIIVKVAPARNARPTCVYNR